MTSLTRKIEGRILLFTGDGKGKTTAALGMVLRASGHGQRILVIQFIKHNTATGEINGCRHLPQVELLQTGLGFVPDPASPHFVEHRRAAEKGLDYAAEALRSRQYDLVVLDEICLAVSTGLLKEDPVMEVLRQTGPETCVVLTGRQCTPGLASLADTATEMRCLKHGFQSGRNAQKGVEY
jgi:cob(I)alamin adenosyltransferase